MALVVPPPNEKKRVKVYELRNNDWFDRGTGFCTGHVVNVRNVFPDIMVEMAWGIVRLVVPGFRGYARI